MKCQLIVCALLSTPGVWAQSSFQSMVVNTADGQTHTFSIEAVDSVTFSHEPPVQRNKWYFMLENPGIADYLRDFEYDPEDYSYHHIYDYRGEPYLDKRQDWPYGVTLGDTTYYNLIPGRTYTLGYVADGASHPVTIHTLGQLRMIRAEGINNIRDLGGWPTADGRHLRYGLLYRGTEMNTRLASLDVERHSAHSITEADRRLMRQDLGIRAELDLRLSAEIPAADASPLGPDIAYGHYAIDHTDISSANSQLLLVRCLRFINTQLAASHPIYIHCVWGADRTGVLCMLLEGLLGVSQSDLDKDFELTSFSRDTRFRNNDNYLRALRQVKALSDQSLQQQFRSWWIAAGANDHDLDTFIALMTE